MLPRAVACAFPKSVARRAAVEGVSTVDVGSALNAARKSGRERSESASVLEEVNKDRSTNGELAIPNFTGFKWTCFAVCAAYFRCSGVQASCKEPE